MGRPGRRMDALESATYDPPEEREGSPMTAPEPPGFDPPASQPASDPPESRPESQPPARSRPLRVVVVDDHPMYRDGLRQMLATSAETEPLGEVIFGASIARRVMAFFAGAPMTAAAAAFPELTDREREILERIARGEANTAIARDFGLTEKTVRNNVSNILNKLQVADRAGAIVRARDAGLGNA